MDSLINYNLKNMKKKYTFLRFCNELQGYNFYNEREIQVYKYELFYLNLTPAEVFKKYKSVLRPDDESDSALLPSTDIYSQT